VQINAEYGLKTNKSCGIRADQKGIFIILEPYIKGIIETKYYIELFDKKNKDKSCP
jgi:hypothetical protein